jgi:hypothetical protein
MARLSDLVQTVADATGETAASVTVIARFLREAGLIATGGRGPSAARMTAPDLASLLLAVTALGDSTKAGETVARVGNFLLEPMAPEHCEALGVKADQSLRDCLATQLEHYSTNPEMPTLHGSARPRSIKISIGQSFSGWKASITTQLCGGDDFTLLFSPGGPSSQSLHPMGRSWFAELAPEVTHQAVLCLRDQIPGGA